MDPNEQDNKKALTSYEQRIKQYLQKPLSLNKDIIQGTYFQQRFLKYKNMYAIFLRSHYYRSRYNQWRRFSRESLPMLIFVTFSTFLIWKMECQYDSMKKKIQNIKSYHELQIEQEDDYIKSVLQDRPVNLDVQIQEPIKKQQRYKFEDEDEEGQFSTKDDFLFNLQKDIGKGIPIPEEYKAQVKDFQNKKPPPNQ